MTRIILAAAALAAISLPVHAEYVKKPINTVNRIEAECNMMALNAMNGMDIIYDYMIAETVKKNCMAAKGYVYKKPPRPARAKKPAGTGRDK